MTGDMKCPTCKGSGRILYNFEDEPKYRDCYDCEGQGYMTHDQQSRYFHESGYKDAEDERYAQEAAEEDEDEYGEAQAALEGEL